MLLQSSFCTGEDARAYTVKNDAPADSCRLLQRRKMYHEIVSFPAKIAQYVRRHRMIAAGERIGVAVSGGADSVALLRALLELRGELGCVLAVVHFNHKIRDEAESEATFVEGLAREFGLEFFVSCGDAKAFAARHRLSLETAARELRYGFFAELGLDKIATAHTLDDQAETVLMKVLRGAGTKGVSGIWPCARRQEAGGRRQEKRAHEDVRAYIAPPLIRPMLGIRRKEVESYLRSLGQEWRDDASNRDVKHTRNKVRHELLPLLEREYNPNIYQQLADAAEVARGEEEYWAEEVRRQEAGGRRQENPDPSTRAEALARDDKHDYPVLSTQSEKTNAGPSTRSPSARSLGRTSVEGGGEKERRAHEDLRAYMDSNGSETGHAVSLREDFSLHLDILAGQPLALRRRFVREAFEQVSGKALDFDHTDALVRFLERRESSLLQLPERWIAVLDWPKRMVRFEEREPQRKAGTGAGAKTSKKQGAGRPS